MSRKHKYYMRGIGVGILVCALILIIARINTPAQISNDEIVSRARALGMVDPGDLSLSEANDLGGGDEGAAGVSANTPVSDTDQNVGNTTDTNTDQNTDQGTDSTDAGIDQNTDQNTDQGTDTTDAGTDQNTDQNTDQSTDITDAGTDQNTDQNTDHGTDTTDAGTDQNTDQNTDQSTDITDAGTDQNTDQNTDQGTDTTAQDYAVLVIERGNSSNVVADKLQALGVIEDSKDFDRYLVNNGYANRISVGTFQIPYGSGYEFIARTITHSL
jgi:hypothetical protein